MTLSDEAHDRLADLVALQPTKNSELQDRWGLDSGSEVHQYLESELKEYYYRDENSLICATPEAAEVVGADPGDEVVRVPELHVRIFNVLADATEDPQSVVSVLHDLEDDGVTTDTDAVRSALRSLQDRGIVEVVKKTVPTFRLAVDRDDVEIEVLDAAAEA